MQGNHRPFLFLARLDDGRFVEREHAPGGALMAGSAQTHPAGGDPLLLDLASQALDRSPGSVVMARAGGATTTYEAPPADGLALIGLRCPPAATAVACSVQCQTHWPDGSRRPGVLAWSVDRDGDSLALFRDEPSSRAQILSAVAGPLLDAALRALGRPTPPCSAPAVWFPDGVFFHQASAMMARLDTPCARRRVGWDGLSALYPLNVTGAPTEPWTTRRLRRRFQASNTWSSLRRSAAGLPAGSPAILPGLTPPVAGWLDDGSFARWVLSRVPDPPSTLNWLCRSLSGPVADHLTLALGDVHDHPSEGS
ncbi:MAG: hypothetical protein F4110_04905 [Acidimicrobiaceae bacterium]|nr:hypothetical protein [Acidimicrobiaceae bacterium]MXZ99552.1 hypothetical protein [Acidimicrobiaceae bacterium]MYE75324.1 hypothetical protein [Acidimicrobiaceae bacterium]MYE97862.1 hypothetical protein [Acidimicrobiaceae bacterium]MYH43395.1 hypothetical protein [Acidimicrobiaceae bacterium]